MSTTPTGALGAALKGACSRVQLLYLCFMEWCLQLLSAVVLSVVQLLYLCCVSNSCTAALFTGHFDHKDGGSATADTY